MTRPTIFLACIALSSCFTPSTGGKLRRGRDVDRPLLDSYDYIVVGCGISGLVVTNRLTENPHRTVLCIEAGQADNYETIIQYPVYVGADIGGSYDWHLTTTPQTQLDGSRRPMPQGKALGGGSILNAMVWNRGGADDYDAWEELGNPGWNWEGMLPYFRKSETYTPVASVDDARVYSINYNPDVHGFDGPVQVSYPRYIYPQSANLFEAHNNLGIPTQFDPNDGTSAGPAFTPQDIDPYNQTRSDARRSYFDPYVKRDNLHVITGQHVTRLLIEGVANSSLVSNPSSSGSQNGNGPSGDTNNEGFGFGPGGSTPPVARQRSRKVRRQDPGTANLRIQGVEFAPNASSTRQTVYATREVIVAAGSLHSTQLMQLSGIGPSALLHQYGIPLALDLPGVGNNLQDHCLVGTFYPYNNASYPSPTTLTSNATFNAEAQEEYVTDKRGPWTAGAPSALAFNPLSLITNNSGVIIANASHQAPTDFLVPDLDTTIVDGYVAQKRSLVSRYGRHNVAAYEIINNNAGSLTVAVMHPFSRGTCRVTSADPFQPPEVDPRWLTNPVDRQVLVEALRFNRLLLAQPSMQELRPAQFVPPANADEAALNTVINNGIRTEFHPSGTLAMLPLEQGGVVNPHLLVYGTQNLRVVDASIFPLIPAAHLQAVVYGVAEKAADIIKADNLQASVLPSLSSANASIAANATASIASTFTTRSNASATLPRANGTLTNPMQTSQVITKHPGLAEPVRISLSELGPKSSQSILVFTTTVPSELPGQLSTIHLVQPTPVSPAEGTTVENDKGTATGQAQISESVASVLTSAGLPPSAVASLTPVIVGSAPETGSTSVSTTEKDMEQTKQKAAIDAIIQWILHFFRLDDK